MNLFPRLCKKMQKAKYDHYFHDKFIVGNIKLYNDLHILI